MYEYLIPELILVSPIRILNPNGFNILIVNISKY